MAIIEPGHLYKAFIWSCQGLARAWKSQAAFRMDVAGVCVAVIALCFLRPGALWTALLLAGALLVPVVELLNSAVEAVIERYGPEHHELAGRAKDMGSAAVFVLMMNVLLVWGLVLGPRLL